MTSEKRLFDYIFEQENQHRLPEAFGQRTDGGQWQWYSSTDMTRWVMAISRALLRLGLQPGDRVATVVSETTPEWVALDYAILRLGLIGVPMYPTISSREYAYILQESAAKYCFTGNDELLEKVRNAAAPELLSIYALGKSAQCATLASLCQPAPDDAAQDQIALDRSIQVRPDDIATFIYTSGTTGNPKGVVLTHRNIVFNVETMRRLIPIAPGDKGLSFLPVSHVFERAVIYAYTAYGASVAFTTPERLGGEDGDIRMIRPHFFTAVPRLLEKVYDKILQKAHDLSPLKKALFFWAMNLADRWDFDQSPSGWNALKWRIADRLIFSKWRTALGGRLKGIVVGASPCPVKIMRTFNAAGIRVREGYGLTEAAPAISFSRFEPGGAVLGTVGRVIDGVTVQIVPDPLFGAGEGEILMKGPGVMVEYYRQPDKTDEMIRDINGERWLCTGDIGAWVKGPGGELFLKITDRKKELLKTSGGKYIAPAPIEALLKGHRLVDQAMVIGDQLKFVSALIVPSVEGLKNWCAQHDVPWGDWSELLQHPRVVARFQQLIERINPNFGQFEQIKKFILVPDIWAPVAPEGQESALTPSLKLKRRVILRKYEKEIARLYE